MSLKTKGMRKMLKPIEIQISRLKALLPYESNKSQDMGVVKSIFYEQIHMLAEKFNHLSKSEINDYKEMKAKLTEAIEKFCTINNVNNLIKDLESNDTDDIAGSLLRRFKESLYALERLESLTLKQKIQNLSNHISEVVLTNQIESFETIKDLGVSFIDMFRILHRYKKSLVSAMLSGQITLYCSQIYLVFNALVELVQEQHEINAPIYNCKHYLCERLCYCFKMIMEVLDAPNPTLQQEQQEKDNHFIFRMDLVLDIIAEMPNKPREEQLKDCADLWLGIEDVFSHAMAIAQVCQPYNFKAITGTCHSIILEHENLKSQLESETPDTAMNNLFLNTLNDALYRLERKVNVSVLTLVMEVFSNPYGSLKKLVKACGNSLSASQRSEGDLTKAIEDFDQTTDKTMQIGRFAIACCKDNARIDKLRSCMASLESLETELVPAVLAFYLHPDNREMRSYLKLLTAQWQGEMGKLHNAINLIIDSGAYCQVVLDELQQRVMEITNKLDCGEDITKSQVQPIIEISSSLASQLATIEGDLGIDNIDKQTLMKIREFKAAILEADAALKTLLVDKATAPQQLRVIKRCKMIVDVLNRLEPDLAILMNDSFLFNNTHCSNNAALGQGDSFYESSLHFPSSVFALPNDEATFSYIKTPYTVKSHKQTVSIQRANTAPRNESEVSMMMPYIKKGREMRTESSIMYKTPKRVVFEESRHRNNLTLQRNMSNVRQHLFSRDTIYSRNDSDGSSESLDLTRVLEQLSLLSDTLSSVKSANSPMSSAALKAANYAMSLSKSLKSPKAEECSSIGGGDAPSTIITTPQRIEDIRLLDKKLQALQKQVAK